MKSELINSLKDRPEFLRSRDLIELGIYKSFSDISYSIKRDLAPPYIKIGERKILYPKASLIAWLELKYNTQDKE
jgi:predicted DNA-binding transcriptional regulator AlpA